MICPATIGLDQRENDFVTARIRAVAAYVGAPLQSEMPCKPNVQILFTADPRKSMRAVLKWAAESLGVAFPHQEDRALDASAGCMPFEGWYVTAGGGSTVLNRDPAMIGGIAIESLWPYVVPNSAHANGALRSILSAVFVIDINQAAGIPVRSIADYLSVLALTVIQSPDHCDPLPNILDLMSRSCASRDKPTGLTAGDLAFLKALYYHNTGIGPTLSRDDIEINMLKQFNRG